MVTTKKPAYKKVVFDFDPTSLEVLKDLQVKWKKETLGATLRECLSIVTALMYQKSVGFSEIVLRNPITDVEKKLAGGI